MVIEDYQSEYVPQKNHRRTPGRTKLFFLFLLVWLVLLVICGAVFFKSVAGTLSSTDALYVITHVKELREIFNKTEAQLCFVKMVKGSPVFEMINSEIQKTGASKYHDVLEGVLAGPNIEAMKNGAISLIAANTKLEGFATSQGVCFICLSKDFLNSTDLDSAKKQLSLTVQALDSSIKETVFLINGVEY